MDDEDISGVREKTLKKDSHTAESQDEMMASADSFGSTSSQQSGVKKKLKTLTFCRRRKGIKEVTQKRKSPWSFKFGPKVRDCSNTSVPIAGDNDTCVCTVYRRTDQASSSVTAAELIDFSKVDCLPKCVLNSNTTTKTTTTHRISCLKDNNNPGFKLPLETQTQFSSSAITTANNEERQQTNIPSQTSFKTKESQTQDGGSWNEDHLMSISVENQVVASASCSYPINKDCPSSSSSSSSKSNTDMSAYRNERLPPNLELAGSASASASVAMEMTGENSNSQDELNSTESTSNDVLFIDEMKINIDDYPVEDWDERARLQRAKEMEEGVEPPPGYKPKQLTQQITPTPAIQEHSISELAMYLQNHLLLKSTGNLSRSIEESNEKSSILSRNVLEMLQELSLSGLFSPPIHTQVDYIHCLVPDLLDITSCSCYWGKMDRYEAEKLLENKPEGTFLLRDSAQEEFLFSVSFQRYGKTLHARIEQWNHKFSFDSHDPGVFSSGTVCGLIEHYKDPSCCMYFDPMLTIPLHRTFPFSLQHLSRSVICNKITYDGINSLKLPKSLKSYLKEYHYKQRVKVRRFDY